jgi:hypothetical protein
MKVNTMTISNSIFKTFVLSALMVAQVHFAYSQNSILPPAKTTFVDQNGKPLTSGKVEFYIPGTSTPKATYQDAAGTISNTNPVVLDAAGRGLILGNGSYRQVVKDRLNNVIWDQVTASSGGGSSSGTGDGNAVGSVQQYAGFVAPSNYAFTYGQEVSRTTYSALFSTITLTQSIDCTSGNATLTNIADTTQLNIGTAIEAACVPAGATIISKTANSVTLSANAIVTTTVSGVFFPWGNGNGLTTFNIPDLRGAYLPGRNNMGGANSSNLTSSFYTDPNSLGGRGGLQSKTILSSNLPSYTPTGTITNGTITFPSVQNSSLANGSQGGVVTGPAGGASNFTTLFNAQQASSTFVGVSSGGGIAVSATVGAGGSGYTAGTQLLTVTGGTCTTQPQFNVTISAGAITAPVLVTAGSCSVVPSNPAATSGGGGLGGTLNITYSAAPFSLIPPSKTVNYIIKVLPDVFPSATSVTSIQGMTGVIVCAGGAIVCAGNTITVNIPTSAVSSIGSMTGAIGCGDGIQCSSSTISVKSLANYWVYAKDFGVVCDGVTNDTTAAQNAITSAAGRPVIFPAGTCVITSTLSYSTSAATFFTQGLQIIGQGREKTIFDNRVASGYLFETETSADLRFQAGVRFEGFKITTTTSPASSGGIRMHKVAYAKVSNIQISGLTGNGIYIPLLSTPGDLDGSFEVLIDQVRMDNIAGWCIDTMPGGSNTEFSNFTLQNSTFQSCGTASGVSPPPSGALRWRGLTARIVNNGFTTNNNVALYVPTAGTASNLYVANNAFENTVSTTGPHVLIDTGFQLGYFQNNECLNNDSFVGKGCLKVSSGATTVANSNFGNWKVRATAGNNAYTAFDFSGAGLDLTTNSIGQIYWQDFDHAGQTRYAGLRTAGSYWARMDGKTGTVCTLQAGYNVASCVRNGVGDYTITFRTPFSNSLYSVAGMGQNVGVATGVISVLLSANMTSTTIRFGCFNTTTGAAMDCDVMSVQGQASLL